jgi:hypothetical protein
MKEEPDMKTKLVLPLVALAMLATALPASAQEPLDLGATLVMDEALATHVGEYTYIVVPNHNGGRFPVPYDVIVIQPVFQTQPEVGTSDVPARRLRPL